MSVWSPTFRRTNSTKNLASKKLLRDRWEWHIGLLRLNL